MFFLLLFSFFLNFYFSFLFSYFIFIFYFLVGSFLLHSEWVKECKNINFKKKKFEEEFFFYQNFIFNFLTVCSPLIDYRREYKKVKKKKSENEWRDVYQSSVTVEEVFFFLCFTCCFALFSTNLFTICSV